MTLAKRIAEAIQSSGKKPAEIARQIGRTSSAITQLMDGTTKSLKAETAQGLETATGFRATWLVSGKGPKRKSDNVDFGPALRGEVPMISWVKAGEWAEANDPLQPGEAERWLPCPVTHSAASFALRVKGDSMTNPHGRSYPHGCVIFVDPERRSPINGDRVIAKLKGIDEVTFKVLVTEGGAPWLKPLNPQYPSIHDEFTILGTVIGMWIDE